MVKSALSQPGQRERYDSKMSQIDWVFVGLLTILAGISVLLLYSVGGMKWDPWAYKQLIFFSVGLLLLIVLALVDLRVWLHTAYPIYGISLALLVAVELFGDVRKGSQRWLDLGFIDFQPSELMKLAIVLALARFYHDLSAKEASFSWKLIFPALILGAPVALVMHQPDLGTAGLIAMTGGAVIILAGLHRWILAAGGIAAVIGGFVGFNILHDYQKQRVLTLFNPEADPSGSGYHILQSKIAMGSGGLLGKGLGLGSQSQLNFLPEKHTDFIMSAVTEELGFAAGFAIFAIYAAIIFISLRISSVSHSHFGRLVAAGVTATFSLYILINGAMVMGMFPVVGVPMPLMSYGGSAMMVIMIGFGILMGVKVHRYQELPKNASVLSVIE